VALFPLKIALKALNFFKDVIDELKKLHVPSKRETYITTVTILVTIAVVSVMILFADFIISKIIGIIFGL
jgi:preprotein translocase SecE subunit